MTEVLPFPPPCEKCRGTARVVALDVWRMRKERMFSLECTLPTSIPCPVCRQEAHANTVSKLQEGRGKAVVAVR